MWVVVILLAGLFLLIGFSVTKSNDAPYLLAGYNTMPEEQRANFDIENYLKIFRRFFTVLSVSIVAGFGLLEQLASAEAAFIFMTMLPIISFPYLVLKSKDFDHGSGKAKRMKSAYWGVGVMGIVFIGLIGLFYLGLADNNIKLREEALVIDGMYGQEVPYVNSKAVEVVDQLPEISMKTNGFALGGSRKGYFKTKDGKQVKLLVNQAPPFLKLTTDKAIIYWNSKNHNMSAISGQVKKKVR